MVACRQPGCSGATWWPGWGRRRCGGAPRRCEEPVGVVVVQCTGGDSTTSSVLRRRRRDLAGGASRPGRPSPTRGPEQLSRRAGCGDEQGADERGGRPVPVGQGGRVGARRCRRGRRRWRARRGVGVAQLPRPRMPLLSCAGRGVVGEQESSTGVASWRRRRSRWGGPAFRPRGAPRPAPAGGPVERRRAPLPSPP
jgi:hypothetical protein